MLTNKRKEKISAFLDNDIHRDELMSFSLSADADDATTAQRYQMMGAVLRGELSDSSFVDVSQAVREALADETKYSMDVATQSDFENTSNDSSDESSAKTAKTNNGAGFFDFSDWLKPVAGMAIAVFVAVIIVTTVSESDTAAVVAESTAKDVVTQPAVQVAIENKAQSPGTQPLGTSLQSVGLNNADLNNASLQKTGVQNAEQGNVNQGNINQGNRFLAPYLVNQHLEYATQDTLQGRMPLVRAVSFEAEK